MAQNKLLLADVNTSTGTGAFVFDTSPTLVTPTLGVATATRQGIGVAADGSRLLLVKGDVSGGVATIERTNATTNLPVGTVIIKGTSTGDMTDGFGSAFQFAIEDNAAVENLIANIQGIRDGADNSGGMVFATHNAGTAAVALTISSTQVLNVPTGDIRIVTAGTNAASVLTVDGVQPVSGKRIEPRTASSTTASTLTPDLSSANVYFRTTQTATLTINAPIGTPVIGETIVIYVDSVGAQTLTINATYKVFGAAFPATTTAGKTFMLSAQYNGTDWKTLWAEAQ